jgi:hypothetical protein
MMMMMMINKIIIFQINISVCITGLISNNTDAHTLQTALRMDCLQFAILATAMYQQYRLIMVFPITATVSFSVRYELIVL